MKKALKEQKKTHTFMVPWNPNIHLNVIPHITKTKTKKEKKKKITHFFDGDIQSEEAF